VSQNPRLCQNRSKVFCRGGFETRPLSDYRNRAGSKPAPTDALCRYREEGGHSSAWSVTNPQRHRVTISPSPTALRQFHLAGRSSRRTPIRVLYGAVLEPTARRAQRAAPLQSAYARMTMGGTPMPLMIASSRVARDSQRHIGRERPPPLD
jgi:hypothetical protein